MMQKFSMFLTRSKAIVLLVSRSLDVSLRRIFQLQLSWKQSYLQGLGLSPSGLLQECSTDLRIALHRIGARIDTLPMPKLVRMIGCERDPSGNLIPSIRVHSCNEDMQRFEESQNGLCTVFDLEVFQIGWLAGGEWAERNACRSEQEAEDTSSFLSNLADYEVFPPRPILAPHAARIAS